MAKLKVKEVSQKLRELRGNVSAAAAALGVTRSGLNQFLDRHGLTDIVVECRQTMGDMAETALMRAVANGEAWAIALVVKTLCKDRGYVERTETEQSGVTEIIVRRVSKQDERGNA